MSEELNLADANLHALHAERAALRLAAQTAGIVVWLDGDTYHASLNDAEATGATLGAAIVALCARVAEREVTTRADLDTLRNGVAWLGSELDRVKAWAGLWKRAATKHLIANWRLRGILRGERARRKDAEAALLAARAYADEVEQERADLRDRALGILRAARQLVGAWRRERRKAEKWRKEVGKWATMVARQSNTADPDEVWEVHVQIDQEVVTSGSVPDMIRQAFREGYARAIEDHEQGGGFYTYTPDTENPQ